ncbi:MAG TPA: hypothetical protein VGL73_16935 [Caulobacteraceae bacterium]
MTRLSLAFFTTAAAFGVGGMIWGIQMGIANNLILAPAHSHLDLVGWVTLALMGGFYALAGDRAPRRLGWINYTLSTTGVVVMIPSLAVLLLNGNKANPGVILGSILTLLGMVAFLAAVVSLWRAAPPAQA